ncbi:hypothetical protein BGZ60DRAFT_528284 [Tricladium varicosporioides]|nr:hypothetical protein BGZ60DRAFT_528284 [Hymenoscyphus varicosporioides]
MGHEERLVAGARPVLHDPTNHDFIANSFEVLKKGLEVITESKMAEDKPSPQKEQIPRPCGTLKPRRKRKRKIFSCTECSRRKQKCDRSFPCSNCIIRNKQLACHYKNESVTGQQLLEEGKGESLEAIKLESESIAQVSAFGFAKPNGNNNTTLGIFEKIWSHNTDPHSLISKFTTIDINGIREKYRSLIRQLPSKIIIETLVKTFFREVNHQYYSLDEGIFRDHLKDWNNLTFSTLKNAPLELSGDMQFFPALLFQCLALGLQFQPQEYDPNLESLKYAIGMSLDDVASDYSQSGFSIMALLGKRHVTLIAVQAGFLRTAFLKNYGMVPESWHSLSQTIRDAQEIGLQKGIREWGKPNEKPEDVLENQWLDQLRRRVWLILSWWDIDMAMLLGRPTTIDRRDEKPPFPIDAPIPRNRREVAPAPRTESDPPTPLSTLLWTSELSAPLWDISVLEKEDPHQKDFAKVEKMHGLINQISSYCPPYFRVHNPDTTFDNHPDCYWIVNARSNLQSNAAFTIMALHRPYIFTNPPSRTLALKAAIEVLGAQRTLFNLLVSTRYKMFCLVLRTFDAVVLIAAIYILYPFENRDDLDDSLQHFEWAMERFHMMGDRNTMAKAALGVLKAIYVRLKKALLPVLEPMSGGEPLSTGVNTAPNFDFSSIAPPQPVNDLLYNNLSTIGESTRVEPQSANIDGGGLFNPNIICETEIWQFDGDFRNDSFWGFMNDYNS